jgi:hypothetical protein
VSSSLESRHFFMTDDRVQRLDGLEGHVLESFALWAVIRWEDGRQEEVEQLDAALWVVHRASGEQPAA